MQLFLVYLGGTAPGANIELHDIRFVAADKIEDTHALLCQQWFGTVKGLHIDSYMQITHIDGFAVSLQRTAAQCADKLFFVNFGGYYPDKIAEQHDFMLCVASSAQDAKAKAKRMLLTDADSPHKDDLLELDECVAIEQLQGWYVHLTPSGQSQPMRPDWSGYKVIG
ncbi:DUF1543 domain-containing protein [Rheinheimera maricola]|uniref:DUF1543 domain-containing protein n=1 Tax=Rheinheimera maricola TaxID=2793282 RepID=A0ABS7XCU6_9GAMM|nr:DUF1543 domain-containing protein [Rheinheimera maricola]MBZ9612553.1 DUF1543 domain-containing protein [Rheinheimera maricola]